MKTARSVPKVNVSSRHRSDCKWDGAPRRIGCPCPKMLTWFRDGKLHRVTADTYDGEVAERKAEEMMAGFEAAAKGEPTPVPAGTHQQHEAVPRGLRDRPQEVGRRADPSVPQVSKRLRYG